MDFNESFKTYSNAELLRVIENPDDYQLQAVETAKAIFSDRQLSEMELKMAKDELEIERQERLRKEQQKRTVEEKVKNIGKSVFDRINPLQKKTPETTIKIISILCGVFFLFQVYKEFGLLRFMFTDSYAEWDFSMILPFLPFIVIPTAILLFYLRKKSGWILLTIVLIYVASSVIGQFILGIKMNGKLTGISTFDNLIPPTTLLVYMLGFFLGISGIIGVISRKEIRIIYSISQRTMILTIAIPALLVGLAVILLIWQ